MLNGLDLFSGIGGITEALSEWVRPIAYCENDRYAQAVLLSRMAEGLIPEAPIWDDVTTIKGSDLPRIDIIYGGFPCQDISVAGAGKGLEGQRSGLFYEIIRLVKETNAPWVFLENVPAIRTRGLKEVIEAFTDLGYDCRWTRLSAQETGAPHIRQRWFLLAYSGCERRQQITASAHGYESENEGWEAKETNKPECSGQGRRDRPVAHADIKRLEVGKPRQAKECKTTFGEGWWSSEPKVGRVVDGLPNRVDRIKCLGNAVVPEQAKEAFMRLVGLPLSAETGSAGHL